ncbi:MAG: hypothetical protein ACOCQN_04185 [Halanaerobiaceae bacterium]
MKWQEVREKYPDSWVLFEAIEAHSESGKRKVDSISILNTFDDSDEATEMYRKIHKDNPQRELYIAHTQKEKLEIEERKWLGIRL